MRVYGIQEVHCGGFVGDGEVCADELRGGEKPQCLGKFPGPNVQAAVAGRDAACLQGGVVHLGRPGVGHGIAKNREPDGRLLSGGGGVPMAQIIQRVDLFHGVG